MQEDNKDVYPIEIKSYILGNEEINAVNARDVHKFLGNKRQFSDWIKQRISDTQAELNYDYFILPQNLELEDEESDEATENTDLGLISQNCEIKKRGGDRRSIDYIITLDLAKEFAMLEKNAKGKEIRRYFITFEKKIKEYVKSFDERLKEQRRWTKQLQERLDSFSNYFRAIEVKREYEALKKAGYID